ncbi:MAG TPA: FtsX-like permease family protein [Bryobacteraceae bacterium]|nr:FtsX-like permease family protein [Bryobacteraceae bacterium]
MGQDPDLWLPMLMQPLIMPGIDGLSEYIGHAPDKLMWLHVFGRRKPGVTPAQVQAEVNVLFRAILGDGKAAVDQSIVVHPFRNGAFHGRDEFSDEWLVLAALAGLVLLVACANVANLLLARAAARSHQLAIRLSIGAARARLIRQFLAESLLLAGLGGSAGIAVAIIASRVLTFLVSGTPDGLKLAAGLDLHVLAFTACATLLTGIAFGLVPALRATRAAVSDDLKETGRSATASRQRTAFAKTLVVGQVALSLLLAMGAGLFLRTLWNLQSVALGYPSRNLLLVEVDRTGISNSQNPNLYRELVQRIRAIPGVRAAPGRIADYSADSTEPLPFRWKDSRLEMKGMADRLATPSVLDIFQPSASPCFLGVKSAPRIRPAHSLFASSTKHLQSTFLAAATRLAGTSAMRSMTIPAGPWK